MNIFKTVIGWAHSAWTLIAGIPSDVGRAVQAVWHYITNVHNALAWFVGGPQLAAVLRFLYAISVFHGAQVAIEAALHRLAAWIWLVWIKPQVTRLDRRITALAAWSWRLFLATWASIMSHYLASLAYTRQLVGIERGQRIKADQAEHAAMLKAVAACLATVQKQASTGYNAGTKARLDVVGKILNDLADRNPEIRGLVSLLVKSVFDLETIDDPVLRFAITKLLGEVISHLGVDRVTGDLIGRLLGPWTGGGKPTDLYHTELDVADRLTALEAQWADFMHNGGPEVEQAGREWKGISGPLADVALLGVFGLAVAEPQAWATGVADTIGVAGNAALDAVVGLLDRV